MSAFPRRKLLPIAAKLLLSLAAIIIALGVLEIALRIMAPLKARRDRFFASYPYFQYNPDWVEYDPLLGYRNRPNQTVVIRRPDVGGFEFTVTTNRLGFRDDDASLDNPDLLVLGDSFCFGWGVAQNETCEAILEKDLRGEPGRTSLRALNMGVSGYGTLQQYLQLRQWAETHDLRGKTVVVLFFSNDWLENMGSPGGVYPKLAPKSPNQNADANDSFIGVSPAEYENYTKTFDKIRLHGLSRVSELARRIALLSTALKGQNEFPPDQVQMLRDPHRPTPPMIEAQSRVIADFDRLRKEKGFRLIFVYIPSVGIYEGEVWQDYPELEKILQSSQIPLIDLRPILNREDYWPLDRHWKPSGHRKAASAIQQKLAEHGQ